jgi:hypothetical protein
MGGHNGTFPCSYGHSRLAFCHKSQCMDAVMGPHDKATFSHVHTVKSAPLGQHNYHILHDMVWDMDESSSYAFVCRVTCTCMTIGHDQPDDIFQDKYDHILAIPHTMRCRYWHPHHTHMRQSARDYKRLWFSSLSLDNCHSFPNTI